MYDAIVVGARCGGAPTAMLLARKGYKVLLLDSAKFPSDIPHGHFIHRQGPHLLKKWGLLDRIVASGCPPSTSFLMDIKDVALSTPNLTVDGVAVGYGPRRKVLDTLLIEAAVEAGAEFRPGVLVENYVVEEDGIIGIRGRQRDSGVPLEERATITIGADGRNSALARFVKAETYEAAPTAAVWSFSYWSGMPCSGLEGYLRERSAIFVFPTHDDMVAVFVGTPIDELPRVRADTDGERMRVLDSVPAVGERLRAGQREERWYGAADLPQFYRKPFGKGWALIGDAGLHKDPFLALGICDALRDIEYLVEGLDEGFSGRRPFEQALGEFERRRNEASREDFVENLRLARFEPPPPELLALRAAIRNDQDAINRFFMAREGLIPRETFFNPENMQKLMGGRPNQSPRDPGGMERVKGIEPSSLGWEPRALPLSYTRGRQ
jgi:flavin-dependent dehydrogenase